MKALTLYINVYSVCFRSPYSVTCRTVVWPWSSSLYVWDCVGMVIIKNTIRTVCFNPSPCDAGVGVCINQCTHQCSCFSFSHSVWTQLTGSHFWFIYINCFSFKYLYTEAHLGPIKIFFLYSLWRIVNYF